MSDPRIARLEQVLAGRGFVQIERPTQFRPTVRKGKDYPDLWYHGMLKAARGAVDVHLHVSDFNLVRAPEVWLAERPDWLQGWRPHLLAAGALENLCYNDFEQYQLLAHDLGPAILRVLEDATQTLDRISHPDSVLRDSRKDFPRLWTSEFQDVYIDCIPSRGTVVCETAAFTDGNGKLTVFVSKDPAALAARLGLRSPIHACRPAIVYAQEGEGLYLTRDGPPGDLLLVRNWLQKVAPKTYQQWHREIQQRTYYQRLTAYHFFVSRGQVVGFFVDYPKALGRLRDAKATRAAFARTVYHEPLRIHRLHAERLDDEYLIRRNLPADASDLRGRRVLLIGAGAIGSFLAQSLVKLGAGRPSPERPVGILAICDRDELTAANIGRHLLGLRYLGRNKATALSEFLRESHPGCEVLDVVGEYRPDADMLAKFDLVLDATGYETYSRFLSRLCRSCGWLTRPGNTLLQIWIEGRGAVVRGLLQDDERDACYDCLWNYTSTVEPSRRHPAYSDQTWNTHGDDGYATMTPFAVSAPLAATALAIDMLTSGTSKPRAKFVSRAVEARGVNRGITKSLVRASKCPGCAAP